MDKLKTRDRIIATADELFYQNGFEQTSFAHIADAIGISRGNFYHHFKTKDEILTAVINRRLTKTEQLLLDWEDTATTPADRITCFIRILIANKAKIILYGCPVGMLSSELARLEHEALPKANQLFALFHTWLTEQFKQVGHKDQAEQLAMHLLGRSQGIATLGQAFQDEAFIQSEVDALCAWLESYT